VGLLASLHTGGTDIRREADVIMGGWCVKTVIMGRSCVKTVIMVTG
jgi:hypothetical protein